MAGRSRSQLYLTPCPPNAAPSPSTTRPATTPESVDALTDLLNDGWRLVTTTAMGGTGGATAPAQFAALVVLEREETKSVAGFRGA